MPDVRAERRVGFVVSELNEDGRLLVVWREGMNGQFAEQSRLRKFEQGDKWSFCLTAGKMSPRIRRTNEHTSPPEPHTGFQGQGGACRRQGREDAVRAGTAV